MGRLQPRFSTLYRLEPGEMRNRVQNAILLAAAAMFLSWPVFYYQFGRLAAVGFARAPTVEQVRMFALGQSLMVFAMALLCSLVGFLYADRLGLPGFGRPADLGRWLPAGLALGLLLAPASYWATDRSLLAVLPRMFPRPWPWALAWMTGTSMSQEVVARFGLVTIGVYLLRWRKFQGHPWPAIALVALVAAIGSYAYLTRLRLDEEIPAGQLGIMMLSSFFVQWLMGEVYVRRGFIAAVSLHFGLGLKLIAYSLLV